MSRNTDQKIRLLVLYDILSRQTDEAHPMHADDLLKELQARGLTVTRRVIPSDITLLNEYGYEVLSYKKKYYYYYVAQRPFDKAEAIMLADVVRASKLTKEQKERLLGKLADLSGVRSADKSPKHLIVCDEPISALDVSIQSQVVNMLEDMQQELGLTYLFIAHDLSVVRHISNRIGVMYLGSLVELGESYELNRHPIHPYTQTLLSAVPVPDPKVSRSRQRIVLEGDIPSPMNPPSGCRFHTRCPYATERCNDEVPEFKEYEPGHWAACHLLEK